MNDPAGARGSNKRKLAGSLKSNIKIKIEILPLYIEEFMVHKLYCSNLVRSLYLY